MDDDGLGGASQLRRLVGAMVGLGGDLDLPVVLQRIIEAAVELVDASYGALGVLDPSGTHLSEFVTVGLPDEHVRRIGELPRGHGILGLLIVRPEPIRLPDLTAHPDSFGFPPEHPHMTSFLGVPLFVRGEVFGNLYLTDKRGGGSFSDVDEELAIGLAAAAAVAIDNARLHERLRDLSLIEDRERIARDLHDTVIQRLFATGLSLQASARLATDPALYDRLQAAVEDLDATVREVRTAIFELHRPPRTTSDSLRREVVALGAELAEPLGAEPSFRFEGPIETAVGADLAPDLLAVVREGLANAARHAGGGAVEVGLVVDGPWLEVVVDDRGPGPGPARAGGRGLDNLRTRAERLGGTSVLEPLPGGGSRLRWRVPVAAG